MRLEELLPGWLPQQRWYGGKGTAVAAVREQLAPFAGPDGFPATDVFCFADLGGTPDDLVERHLELVTDVLAPGLAQPVDAVTGGALS